MDVMDLCTIFGNILDNAIECELGIADKSRRLIHLTVYGKRGFLVIRCGNYCPQPPTFRDGLPVTTKADRNYHGFGMRSIRMIVHKYEGELTVYVADGIFHLNILFSLAT